MDHDGTQTGEFDGLPGAELVRRERDDLSAGRLTEYALLMLVAAPRLRSLGIDVPVDLSVERPYEHPLYEKLEDAYGDGAYSRYNSLIRRIVSFSAALSREVTRGSS